MQIHCFQHFKPTGCRLFVLATPPPQAYKQGGGFEGDTSPPEFDMVGTYGKMSPLEFQEMQLKKYNVNTSDAAIVSPLEQHYVWELVVSQTNQISSR